MSAGLSGGGGPRALDTKDDHHHHDDDDALPSLVVEVVFHEVDERQADSIAAEMVSRAHQLANLPECECDVDVNVQLASPDDDPGLAGAGTG